MSNICNCQRRNFIKLFLTGSVGLSYWLSSSLLAQADYKAKALVLSCIDFRFIDFEQNFLKDNNLNHQFDWLSLAGASLALADFPSHADTVVFWEQLDLSYQLHHIEKVIILDHQDCGAYGTKFDVKLSENPVQELSIHQQYLSKAKSGIQEKYPNLEVELYFVYLDGKFKKL
ncbi:carbonic anhydrase [Geminocystis sp. CENA526]|uniref:carbonic anhydrase n=1 Tax=Geminocystis sp. CENA526 TaxID=1355871 RepID=UPI003D6F0992